MMFLIVFHELTTTDQILSLETEKKERKIVSAAKYQSIPTFELLLPKGESKAFKLYQNLACVCVRMCACVCVRVQEIAQAEQRKA